MWDAGRRFNRVTSYPFPTSQVDHLPTRKEPLEYSNPVLSVDLEKELIKDLDVHGL
jgi:hypothetical protein